MTLVGPETATAAGQNGARVLVVDDESNITELVAMALRYEGFTVQTAATGRAALEAVTLCLLNQTALCVRVRSWRRSP